MVEDARRHLEKALGSMTPKLMDLTWAAQRAAMIRYWGKREDLEALRLRFERKDFYDDECLGTIEALLELHRGGLDALAQRLELSVTKRKISETDVAACFILGAARQSEYAPLFLKVFREVRGRDFWSDGLRRRALISFAYVTLPAPAVQHVIAERLVEQRKKLRRRSWWFGHSTGPEFIAICNILWNIETPLNSGTVAVLQDVAMGKEKWNAKEAIALLLLKGLEVPRNALFDVNSYDLKWAKDFMQHDKGLNFAYYWRCRPGV